MAIVHNTLCAWRLILSWQQKWHRSKMWQCVKSLLAVCCHFQSFSPRVVSLLLFGALRHRRGVAVGEWGLRAGLGCELRRGIVPLQGSDWKSPGRVSFTVFDSTQAQCWSLQATQPFMWVNRLTRHVEIAHSSVTPETSKAQFKL